jgi:hypothetical protein
MKADRSLEGLLNLAIAITVGAVLCCLIWALAVQMAAPTAAALKEAKIRHRASEMRLAEGSMENYLEHYRAHFATLPAETISRATKDEVFDALLGATSPLNPDGIRFILLRADAPRDDLKEKLFHRFQEHVSSR